MIIDEPVPVKILESERRLIQVIKRRREQAMAEFLGAEPVPERSLAAVMAITLAYLEGPVFEQGGGI